MAAVGGGKSGMVSIKDVARQVGVSIGTVSNALNRPDRVSAGTRARVMRAVDELGYVRSESARQLRVGQSRIMALLVLDIGNPFFADVARGVEQAARAEGLGVMLCNSEHDETAEELYLSLFAEQRVRGVLITPADLSGKTIKSFQRNGIPYVFVDRVVAADEACSVSVDDVSGGELAVRHLIEAGHTSVAYVTGPLHLAQCEDRLAGALKALGDSGLQAEDLTVLEQGADDVASGRDAGSRFLGLHSRPTAIFCSNDLLALGVLQTLFAAGVGVPEDVSIVGYDDIEFAEAAAVPLTSVRQPAVRMGRTAAELLLQETGGNPEHVHQRIAFQPELIVRRSTLPRQG